MNYLKSVVTIFILLAGFKSAHSQDTLYTERRLRVPEVKAQPQSRKMRQKTAIDTTLAVIDKENKSESDSCVFELGKMVVSASRKQQLLEHTQSYTVIRAEEWEGTGLSIADVVAEQTGVQTRRYGGTGSFQTVSIRGIQGSKVLVLLDGIPLNSAVGDVVDLGKINPNRISEIEIYKGIVPSRFGGNSIGGVINLKSKTETKQGAADISSSFGAYGYMNHTVSVYHSPDKNPSLFGSAGYLQSTNDFSYLDRNNTPYNASDDVVRTIQNHRYRAFETRIHPSFSLPGKRKISSGISYSSVTSGIPAKEGHTNRTARYDEKRVDGIIRLVPCAESTRTLTFTPELGVYHRDGLTFWTSLDSSFGHSHGTITAKENAYGELGFKEWVIFGGCMIDWIPIKNLMINTTVSATHNDFDPTTEVTGFPHGDWHSEQQTGTLSGEADGKIGPFGAKAGGCMKMIRCETDGGTDGYTGKTVSSSDTVNVTWSVFGGFYYQPVDPLLLFVNGARYNKPPTLRERYGAKGGMLPNPALIDETGIIFEGGVKINVNDFYWECIGFHTKNNNAIIMISDGYMTKPANLGGALIYGIETNVSYHFTKFLSAEIHATLQHAENRARMNNWYGKRLPNEPVISTLGKLAFGPFKGLELQYWADFRSYFFRDPGNTPLNRVPEDGPGICFHNALVRWSFKEQLELTASIRNIGDFMLHYEEIGESLDAGYSWILYPGREWCLSVSYSF